MSSTSPRTRSESVSSFSEINRDGRDTSISSRDDVSSVSYYRDSSFCYDDFKDSTPGAGRGDSDSSVTLATKRRLVVMDKGGSGQVLLIDVSEETGEIEKNPEMIKETWAQLKGVKDFSAVFRNGLLYVIGGCSVKTGELLDGFKRYDPRQNAWTDLPPLMYPRSNAAAIVFNDKIVVTGGLRLCRSSKKATVACEEYEFRKKSWKRIGCLPAPRYDHACSTDEKTIFISGGCSKVNPTNSSHRNVWMYDRGAFQEIDEYPVQMACARSGHVMTYHRGSLYVTGGGFSKQHSDFANAFPNLDNAANSIEEYAYSVADSSHNPATVISPWNWALEKMTLGRSRPGHTILGSKMYLIGGSDESGRCVRKAESFNLDEHIWKEEFSIPKGKFKNVACGVLNVAQSYFEPSPENNTGPDWGKHKWILW